MATFKVGQRVKVKCPGSSADGREGVVWLIQTNGPVLNVNGSTTIAALSHRVDVDGIGKFSCVKPYYFYGFEAHELQPLTDPKAEQFLASIRNMKPYFEPTIRVYPKEKV